MQFIKSAIKPDAFYDLAYYFCFDQDNILVAETEGKRCFPLLTDQEVSLFQFLDVCFIGLIDGKPCYVVKVR